MKGSKRGSLTEGTPGDLTKSVANDLDADEAVEGQDASSRYGSLIIKPVLVEEQ